MSHFLSSNVHPQCASSMRVLTVRPQLRSQYASSICVFNVRCVLNMRPQCASSMCILNVRPRSASSMCVLSLIMYFHQCNRMRVSYIAVPYFQCLGELSLQVTLYFKRGMTDSHQTYQRRTYKHWTGSNVFGPVKTSDSSNVRQYKRRTVQTSDSTNVGQYKRRTVQTSDSINV